MMDCLVGITLSKIKYMNTKLERIQFITSSTETLSHVDFSRKACEAGVKWIQYRNKNASSKTMWEEALKIKTVCKEFKAKLIINDNPNLAFEAGADGVHLGKEDVSIEEARNLIGDKFIIGASCNNIDDIIRAQYEGANYVGLGPYQFTKTKSNLNSILDKSGFEEVMNDYAKNKLTIPVYAIGGVNADDVDFFLSIGIYGAAVSSALINSDNMSNAFQKFNSQFFQGKRINI